MGKSGSKHNGSSKAPTKMPKSTSASSGTPETGDDNVLPPKPKHPLSTGLSSSPKSRTPPPQFQSNSTIIITFSRLNIDKKRIGKGGNGVVHSGLLDGKTKVAIKKLDVSTSEQHEGIMAEAKMMARLGHKYVVRMHGVSTRGYREMSKSMRVQSPLLDSKLKLADHHRGESLAVPSKARRSIYIVMELCDCSLSQLLDDPSQDADFDTHSLNIALQVAETMAFLHGKDVSHRDLKPGNILLRNGDVRLCDFGLSKNLSETSHNTLEIGTPTYMPPELFVDPSLDPDGPGAKTGPTNIDARKSDVYAFGIILWALFYRKHPYAKLSTFRIIYKVKMEDMRPEIDDTTSPDILNLFQSCWHTNQKTRPDFHKIYKELTDIKSNGSWFKRS